MVRQADTAPNDKAGTDTTCLMEQVLDRENLLAAYARVVRNGGAAGVDGMTVDESGSVLPRALAADSRGIAERKLRSRAGPVRGDSQAGRRNTDRSAFRRCWTD